MWLAKTIVEGHSMTRIFAVFLLVLSSWSALYAQTGNASLTGRVTDQSKGVVAGARVTVTNVGTNEKRSTLSSNDGNYSVNALPPGSYKIEIEKAGFENIVKPNLVLHTEDAIEINFELQVGSSSQTITVTDSVGQIDTSPAVSTTVDREFVENMPLNGRSFQDLIQLAPGTVSDQQGYYSINGQRTDSNNFTVDGVSANLGGYNNASVSGNYGAGLSGSSPAQTVLGTTQSLASVDSLQEFKIQTSGYTAEYGRNPGGQLQFNTRSGTNDIHGTLFEYLRNTAFDANSYTNDYFGYPKTAEHQNDFGGTVGGPLVIPKLYNGKGKTFFFISYEGLRLLLPAFESEYVPTQSFRQWAAPSIRPYLNASPLPSPGSPGNQDGCTIPDPTSGQPTACDALFTYAYSYPSSLDSFSVRVDHDLRQGVHAFVRYAYTPSSIVGGAESVYTAATNVRSWTAGVTANITSALLDELRFNYSSDAEEAVQSQRAIGGSIPLPEDLLVPTEYAGPYASGGYGISVPGTSLNTSVDFFGIATSLHQYQIVDSLVWTRGDHTVKSGGDWRRLTPTYTQSPYSSAATSQSLADIQQGNATTLFIQASAPGKPVFDNLSLFAQDHWRISPKLSIDYGLRWEFNPPPGPSNGHYPVSLTSSNLATASLAPLGTPPYKTTYDHFAPRFGFAWNAIPSKNHALTVRGGFGIFYDTGQGLIGNSYAYAYPFSASGPTLMEVPLPLSNAVLAPPSLNIHLTPPYPILNNVSDPALTLPYTEQWNLSIDEALNARNTLTASYVGNVGRKLLYSQQYAAIPGNPDFTYLTLDRNASGSSYNALQVQDTGKIAAGLDLVASFTWAHALDNTSNDFAFSAPVWGNSDYDLRKVLNLALNFQTSSAGSSRWMRALTHGWVLANRFSAQTGYPLSVQQTEVFLPNGVLAIYQPDRLPGVPIYLHGSAADLNGEPVPGGWRLNPAAFAAVPVDANGVPIRQGNLGRNYVRNPGFWALNTAVQRSFPIHEALHLVFRVDAFNIFNHPNLGNADNRLSDSTFGQLNIYSPTTIGSSNALYAMGAPRSLQFSLKLQF
jgi:hypothetical protein